MKGVLLSGVLGLSVAMSAQAVASLKSPTLEEMAYYIDTQSDLARAQAQYVTLVGVCKDKGFKELSCFPKSEGQAVISLMETIQNKANHPAYQRVVDWLDRQNEL